jgi:ferredoxin-type protein NapG/ferredoxin-type protein NapH
MRAGDTDRRGLFQSLVGDWLERLVDETERRVTQQRYLRPPGALPELGFLAACTRCGECVRACPVQAILTAPMSAGLAAGTPYLELDRQPCVACTAMPCAQACPTEALTVPPDVWAGYRLAELEFHPERCITFRGTACQACADACPVGAAALSMDEGGHPVLRREGCVGCGVCVQACVTRPSSYTLHFAEG